MLSLEQFSVLQEKRRTVGLKTDWQYFLYDALICLELDMPDSAMESLKIALRKAGTEIKESENDWFTSGETSWEEYYNDK